MVSPKWSRWSAAGLCCLAFAYMASILRTHFGFPLDDSWIHQTVAQNLADTGVLGYFRGVHGSGSSSLMWTVLLWIKWAALAKVNPIVYCAVLNGIFLGGCGYLLKKLTEDDGLTGAEGWILALAPALNGNFVWFGMLGMEHVLFVLLSLVVIVEFFSKGRRAVWVASIAQGILTLTRPEGVALGALLLLFRRPAGRTWKAWGGVALGSIAGMLISMRVNWTATHTLLPLTMKGRQFLFLGTTHLLQMHRLSLIQEWGRRVMKAWVFDLYVWGHPWVELVATLSMIGLVFAAIEIVVLAYERRWRMVAVIAWAGLLDLIYLLVLPATGHGGRYQPLHVLLLLPLMFAGLYRTICWLGNRRSAHSRKRAMASVLAVMVISTVSTLSAWRKAAGLGIDQINEEHGVMAAWLAKNIPDEGSGKMAVFDIGKIGFGIHGQLMDLGGLTDPHYLPYLFEGRVTEYLDAHGIEYVVLPTDPDSPLFTRLIFRRRLPIMQELKTVCYSGRERWIVDSASEAAAPCQTAYRVEYHRNQG